MIVALLAAACSNGGQAPSFSLSSASADPGYWCPGNANNAPYDVHVTVTARNTAPSAVAITGVTTKMTLEDTSGEWLEKAGDSYDAGKATFAPASIASGSTATVKVKFQSACTSPAYVVSDKGAAPASYGDYRIVLKVTTSAGTYSVSAGNLHRIVAA